jgi:hypothetical protein
MDQLEQLQQLWQRQTAPGVPAADAERLTRSLRAYGRRQYIVNIVKAIIVAALLTWALRHTKPSVQVIAGYGLVGIAAAAVLVSEWRSRRALARLEFGTPSLGFVRSTIERLHGQRDPCRRYYWPFLGSLVIAMNLVIEDTHRLWVRALASGLPFAAFELGKWVRRKRFELECRPLIDQLSALRSALEERVD